MNQSILIEVKDQYGAQVFHPVCQVSKLFAQLARTKTLTNDSLKTIKELGYKIEIKAPQYSI